MRDAATFFTRESRLPTSQPEGYARKSSDGNLRRRNFLRLVKGVGFGVLADVLMGEWGIGKAWAAEGKFSSAGQEESLIAAWLQPLLQQGLPGACACLVMGDQVFGNAVGVSKVGSPTPLAAQGLMHLGSNVKAMTATVVARLVEKKLVRWEDTLERLLPKSLWSSTGGLHPDYKAVSVEDLLTHRSGLAGYADVDEAIPLVERDWGTTDPRQKRARVAAYVLTQAPASPVGQHGFRYSNGGYMVIAALMEWLTGLDFAQLLQQEVLAPLGVSGFPGYPIEANSEQAWGHGLAEDGKSWLAQRPSVPGFDQAFLPTGNWSMSLPDYGVFLRDHLRGLQGNGQLLRAESYARMHTGVGASSYGHGWAIIPIRGYRSSFHTGSAESFVCFAAIQAERRIAFALVVNAEGDIVDSAMAERFLAV